MPNPEEAEAFEWDDDEDERGNTMHLARHGIAPHEAEQVSATTACSRPTSTNDPATGCWSDAQTADAP